MIISASRRTDIPAFYHEWFLNRIKAGFLLVRNPYDYNKIKRVSLLPENIDAIIFWTRNPKKMLSKLDVLEEYNYYFQYTITGYSKTLDKHGPNPYDSIVTFNELSKKIGRKKVIWRYDPILLTNETPVNEHKRLFKKIASAVSGYTDQVVISFADLYKKTEMNLNKVPNLKYRNIINSSDELEELCYYISSISKSFDLRVSTCSESCDLSKMGISSGKCIDDRLLKNVFGIEVSAVKDSSQREACGCIKSVDIGVYNTCLHGCTYCYATFNSEVVKENMKIHDPDSPFLLGDAKDVNPMLLQEVIIQQRLF